MSCKYLLHLKKQPCCILLVVMSVVALGCQPSQQSFQPADHLKSLNLDDAAVSQLLTNLTRRLAENKQDGNAWGELAMAYEANGYQTTAHEYYLQAAQYDSSNPQWFYHRAILTASAGEYMEAIGLMQRALAQAPDYGPGFLWLGQWLLEVNHLKEAEEAFREADKLHAGPVAELGLANVELRRGDTQQALERLNGLTETFDHAQVHRLRMNALRRLGQPIAAAEAAERATENAKLWWSDPWHDNKKRFTVGFQAKLSVVEDLLNQNRIPDALLILDELQQLKPDDVNLLYQYAKAQFLLGESELAREHLQRALLHDATHYPSHLLLSEIYSLQGNIVESINHLNDVIEIHPSLSAPHERLAKINIQQEEHELSLQHIQRAIELDAKDKEVFYYGGVLNGLLGDCETAVEYFNRSLRVEPDYLKAHFGLAQCYGELNQFTQALEHLEKARALGLDDQSYQETKTWLEQHET